MIVPDGIILSISGKSITIEERNFFKKIKPLGFVLFSRNFKDKNQIIKLIKELKKVSLNKFALIFIDQEGGKVQRLKNSEFTCFAPQKRFGEIYLQDKKQSKKLSYFSSFLLGSELKSIGVDVNFSPVCDLFFEFGNKIIGDRSFGSDPYMVRQLVSQFSKGLRHSGVLPVLKHFPGHGRSLVDTHHNPSEITTNLNTLWKEDFIPFLNLKNESLLMLAHIKFTKIDNKVATYSKRVNNLLRKKFLFKGLILTDDISMKALDDDLTEITKNSYKAGCDVVLHCNGKLCDIKKIYPYVISLKKKYYHYFLNDMLNLKIKNHNISKIKEMLFLNNLIDKKCS